MADDGASTTALPQHLLDWISATSNAAAVRADRIAGGGRKQAWRIDVERSSGSTERLFFRWDPVDPAGTGDPWTVRKEAAVYGALNGSGLPVAKLLGLHPTEQAMLATWAVHDLDHLAQIGRVMGRRYTEEVGPWREYLPVLKR